MVFIRPKILRDGTEATIATNAKYNYVRDIQAGKSGTKIPQMRGDKRPIIPPLESYEEENQATESSDDSGE
jgi:type II secretory pathway component GspD/PulD (secretin)